MEKKQMNEINNMILALKEKEKQVNMENSRLKQLSQIQDALIDKQREILLEVVKTSKELIEVEQRRKEIKEMIEKQKHDLLISSAKAKNINSIIDKAIGDADHQAQVADGPTGIATLKIIEQIQNSLFTLTESCLDSQDLSVPEDKMKNLVSSVNEIIQNAIDSGFAKESPDDTIRRQSFIISSMVPQIDE
ncbi:hypothetical protein GPJ56_002509 [Histomonas meleagridis]|uniref:uncharacterized protein n=1 Tax=Histomonas meleagridis TaxID=135588 RepID=UPI00355ACAD5|nr:hypothetical protein GPJ56_002509 [Histomonas meleagridis]KAH0806028.1 hypothetical protein GO595_001189 [Histomonas meleagridis]